MAPLDDSTRFRYHHTLFIQGQDQHATQLTQELRWTSPIGSNVHVLVGAFHLSEEVRRTPSTIFRFIAFGSEGEFGHWANSRSETSAAYGNIDIDLSEKFGVAAGARWTRDHKRMNSTTYGTHFLGFRDHGVPVDGWSANNVGAWAEVTPSVSLTYRPADGVRVYALAAKGFKSGGFNDEAEDKVTVATAFGPETAWNAELGWRLEIADGRGHLSGSVYHIDYSDMQVEQFVRPDPELPPVEVTTNAGAVTIRGAEMEGTLRLGRELNLYGSYAYLESAFDGIVLNDLDLSGHSLAYAPAHKFNVGASFRIPAASRGTLEPRIEVSYEDSFFSSIENTPISRVRSHTLVDAFLAWTAPNGRTRLQLGAKNLFNELYSVTATEVPVGDRYDKFGPPRTVTFVVSHHL